MSVVDSARTVVETHSHVMVDADTGEIVGDAWTKYPNGLVLDAVTANVLCMVYDALSEKARKTLLEMPVQRAVDIAWKLVK